MAARKKAPKRKTTARTAAKKKTTARKTAKKKTTAAKRPARKDPRKAFEANLKALERQLPPALARGVRELRRSMGNLERQIDKARASREARWQKLETQIRKDTSAMLRRLERAIAPSKPRKKAGARKRS